ncbi:MAG: ComEA family DNA-binding protein [Bryobacteraceae bacterium]
MKVTLKLSVRIALAGLLAMSLQIAGAQSKDSKKAAKQDAASKDENKPKKSGKAAPSAPVDLNTASQAELEKLPGVGMATAKKIVSSRPYSSVADLSKAGLTAKTIQELTPMVMVGPATAAAPKPTRATPPPSTPSAAPPASSKAASPSAPATYKPATPPPGPGMVWVNTATKVFHRPGTKWYGNTKTGKYMTEADAVKAGYRESKEN